jgi:large-conductance mechanosensitive channel
MSDKIDADVDYEVGEYNDKIGTIKKKPGNFYQNIKFFLNSKTGTILTTAMGMAIGLAYKDAVSAIVESVIKPLIVFIIINTRLNKIYDFTYFFKTQSNVINITALIQTVITFIIVVTIVYYLTFIMQ